jgi:hypothetical protein
MADLNLKGEGDRSTPGNRQPGSGVWDGVPGDPCDMAKAGSHWGKHSGWCGSVLAISVHAALSVRQDQVGEAEDAAVCLDVLPFAGVEPFADFCGAGVGAVSE